MAYTGHRGAPNLEIVLPTVAISRTDSSPFASLDSLLLLCRTVILGCTRPSHHAPRRIR